MPCMPTGVKRATDPYGTCTATYPPSQLYLRYCMKRLCMYVCQHNSSLTHRRNLEAAAGPTTTSLTPSCRGLSTAASLPSPDGGDGGGDRLLSYSHCAATSTAQHRLRDTNVSTAQSGHSGLKRPRIRRPPRTMGASISLSGYPSPSVSRA